MSRGRAPKDPKRLGPRTTLVVRFPVVPWTVVNGRKRDRSLSGSQAGLPAIPRDSSHGRNGYPGRGDKNAEGNNRRLVEAACAEYMGQRRREKVESRHRESVRGTGRSSRRDSKRERSSRETTAWRLRKRGENSANRDRVQGIFASTGKRQSRCPFSSLRSACSAPLSSSACLFA